MGNHRGKVSLQLIGFFEFHGLPSRFFVEFGLLERDTHLIADRLEKIYFLRSKLARRTACELNNSQHVTIRSNWNVDKRFNPLLFQRPEPSRFLHMLFDTGLVKNALAKMGLSAVIVRLSRRWLRAFCGSR